MKKVRVKKEQKETATPSVEGDHLKETTLPTTPSPIEEGITETSPPAPYFPNRTFSISNSNLVLYRTMHSR